MTILGQYILLIQSELIELSEVELNKEKQMTKLIPNFRQKNKSLHTTEEQKGKGV